MTKSAQKLQEICGQVPFFRFLDFTIHEAADDGIRASMPFAERHIGNPVLKNYHGGIVASFMEAIASVSVSDDWSVTRPKPINLNVEYLRPARPGSLSAHAKVSRKGKRIASVETIAWQDEEDRPVAKGLFHFLLV